MSDPTRILFAGGGTGGHLYPGLSVAAEIRAQVPDAEMAFFVTRRPIDRRLLTQHPYAAEFEKALGFSMRPWHWPAFGLRLLANLKRARAYLRSFRPHAVVGLGGFGSYAAVRAAQKLGLPTFILNPDLIVGRANRHLVPGATAVFCHFAETTRSVRSRGRVEVIGCPVRPDLFGVDRRQACRALGLDPEKKTLAVTGASGGARNINRAVVQLAGRWQQLPDWQVLHLTGRDLYDEVAGAIGRGRPGYHLRDYVDAMGLVYAASDLVLARAGAGTVAELTALGLPAVLMPYPYHRDRHQVRHAELLERAGAAVMVPDRSGVAENADSLWAVLPQLMEDASRRSAMAEAARAIGHPTAARSIATSVLSVAREAAG